MVQASASDGPTPWGQDLEDDLLSQASRCPDGGEDDEDDLADEQDSVSTAARPVPVRTIFGSDARDVVYRDAKLAEVRRRVRAVTRRWEQAGKALAIEDHEHVLSYYVGRNGRDEGADEVPGSSSSSAIPMDDKLRETLYKLWRFVIDPATAHAAPAQLRALIATLYKVAFGSHISNHMAVLLAEEDCDIEMEGGRRVDFRQLIVLLFTFSRLWLMSSDESGATGHLLVQHVQRLFSTIVQLDHDVQVKGFKALDSVRGCSPHRPARASAQQRSVFRLSVSVSAQQAQHLTGLSRSNHAGGGGKSGSHGYSSSGMGREQALRVLSAPESQLGYCTCSPTYGTVKAPALIGARQLRRHHSGGLSGSWRVPVYLLDPRADSCELVRAQGTGGSNGSDISITATRMDLPRQLQILSSSPSLSPGGSDLDTDDEAAAAAHRKVREKTSALWTKGPEPRKWRSSSSQPVLKRPHTTDGSSRSLLHSPPSLRLFTPGQSTQYKSGLGSPRSGGESRHDEGEDHPDFQFHSPMLSADGEPTRQPGRRGKSAPGDAGSPLGESLPPIGKEQEGALAQSEQGSSASLAAPSEASTTDASAAAKPRGATVVSLVVDHTQRPALGLRSLSLSKSGQLSSSQQPSTSKATTTLINNKAPECGPPLRRAQTAPSRGGETSLSLDGAGGLTAHSSLESLDSSQATDAVGAALLSAGLVGHRTGEIGGSIKEQASGYLSRDGSRSTASLGSCTGIPDQAATRRLASRQGGRRADDEGDGDVYYHSHHRRAPRLVSQQHLDALFKRLNQNRPTACPQTASGYKTMLKLNRSRRHAKDMMGFLSSASLAPCETWHEVSKALKRSRGAQPRWFYSSSMNGAGLLPLDCRPSVLYS